jgi:hypothetical protein
LRGILSEKHACAACWRASCKPLLSAGVSRRPAPSQQFCSIGTTSFIYSPRLTGMTGRHALPWPILHSRFYVAVAAARLGRSLMHADTPDANRLQSRLRRGLADTVIETRGLQGWAPADVSTTCCLSRPCAQPTHMQSFHPCKFRATCEAECQIRAGPRPKMLLRKGLRISVLIGHRSVQSGWMTKW